MSRSKEETLNHTHIAHYFGACARCTDSSLRRNNAVGVPRTKQISMLGPKETARHIYTQLPVLYGSTVPNLVERLQHPLRPSSNILSCWIAATASLFNQLKCKWLLNLLSDLRQATHLLTNVANQSDSLE
jgi:hypothetical protein